MAYGVSTHNTQYPTYSNGRFARFVYVFGVFVPNRKKDINRYAIFIRADNSLSIRKGCEHKHKARISAVCFNIPAPCNIILTTFFSLHTRVCGKF